MTTSGGGDTKSAAPIEFEPPLACIRRILKHALPSSTNVGKDASAAFARACGIFVIYITACANDFAHENRRQTITANDVLAALKELDFDEFTPQLKTFLENYRAAEKSKREAKAASKAAAAKTESSNAAAASSTPDALEKEMPEPKRRKVEDKDPLPSPQADETKHDDAEVDAVVAEEDAVEEVVAEETAEG
eukprot:CAMPEP_0194048230 /NCGR_PEP_ID=MMETSP0009_2-20130614/26800_1 /TAXON_ID=210454 /ORGANISM="Grammatophora oceanica, Strain CCMP 410" /LENGTH=191 /DNA_ID=CAMNT_0038694051 /DNA_START=12 /DNA_END=587 /DNA_ORIENTATION=+